MEFTWPELEVIPSRVPEIIRGHIIASGSYGPTPTPAEMDKLVSACGGLLAVPADAAREIIAHIRATTIIEESIVMYRRAPSAARNPKIKKLYSARGILAASRAARLTPMVLFKELMIASGHTQDATQRAISNKINPEVYFSPRDVAELRAACAADATCPDYSAGRMAVAEANEQILVDYFRARGVPLKTQADLIREGNTRATPDILFEAPVTLGGIVVKWLDNKDYTCLAGGRLLAGTRKQAERNIREWGPGGFCFRGSCMSRIDQAAVFDTMWLFSRGEDRLLIPREAEADSDPARVLVAGYNGNFPEKNQANID